MNIAGAFVLKPLNSKGFWLAVLKRALSAVCPPERDAPLLRRLLGSLERPFARIGEREAESV